MPDVAAAAPRRRAEIWRGLEELAGTEEFRRFLAAEFPAVAEMDGVSRRTFLRIMGASLALTGLAGCGDPPREAVPYVTQPEQVVPGRPRYYATAMLFEGFAQPVIGETHVGRPTRLEGNPRHPVSEGATDAFTQAAVLQLYDPDRSQAPRFEGSVTTWAAFEAAAVALAARLRARNGAGLHLLTGAVTSPTLLRQFQALRAVYPEMRWHVFEPVADGLRHEAAALVFGRPLDVQLRLGEADAIVSLDDDFLGPGLRQVPHARGWRAARMRLREAARVPRLTVFESTPTLTGVQADRRHAVAASRIPLLATAIAHALGVPGAAPPSALTDDERRRVDEAAAVLRRHGSRALFLVGAYQPAPAQALMHLVNAHLGATGRTLAYTDPVATPAAGAPLQTLARAIAAGEVETLVVLGVDPAYSAPADLGFRELLRGVPLVLHAGLYYDATAAESHWHLPLTHPLESWSDARAVDGTATILQPLVAPFYGGRNLHEIVSAIGGRIGADAYETVRETWRLEWGGAFESRWLKSLHDGLVAGSAAPAVTPEAGAVDIAAPAPEGAGLEAILLPDPSIWDGRFVNLAWLQELPKPLTKLTWENIVAIAPRTAERLGLANGDRLEVAGGGGRIVGPVWIMPGQADETVALFLGYGQAHAGRVGRDLGYDAYRLRTVAHPWIVPGIRLEKREGRTELATTQLHFSMEGFDFVRETSAGAVSAAGATGSQDEAEAPSLYSRWSYGDPSWGMAIDLDLCIGCNACVTACQAENNIPVVGKEQVAKGREMHWLRVDRYYKGSVDDPQTFFQPVPCMHCEKAPCEMGCPVNATVHGPEGLNQMVYNRCIGTRTCSSYCPYKVRRFNWHDYTGEDEPAMKAVRNPDVTVRARGVMEKCTYCVQRISAARIAAKNENRPIRDGEVVTACQQACPTGAILFGNLAHPDTAVSRAKATPRNYALLEELNTRPRTTYLKRLRPAREDED